MKFCRHQQFSMILTIQLVFRTDFCLMSNLKASALMNMGKFSIDTASQVQKLQISRDQDKKMITRKSLMHKMQRQNKKTLQKPAIFPLQRPIRVQGTCKIISSNYSKIIAQIKGIRVVKAIEIMLTSPFMTNLAIKFTKMAKQNQEKEMVNLVYMARSPNRCEEPYKCPVDRTVLCMMNKEVSILKLIQNNHKKTRIL